MEELKVILFYFWQKKCPEGGGSPGFPSTRNSRIVLNMCVYPKFIVFSDLLCFFLSLFRYHTGN